MFRDVRFGNRSSNLPKMGVQVTKDCCQLVMESKFMRLTTDW